MDQAYRINTIGQLWLQPSATRQTKSRYRMQLITRRATLRQGSKAGSAAKGSVAEACQAAGRQCRHVLGSRNATRHAQRPTKKKVKKCKDVHVEDTEILACIFRRHA